MKYLFGLFLLVHGLIHLSFIQPEPKVQPGAPAWPFDITTSWVGLPSEILKPIGILLTIVAAVGFALAALGTIGILIPTEWLKLIVIVSSVVSLLLIGLFWNNWFVVGPLIDIALIIYFLR